MEPTTSPQALLLESLVWELPGERLAPLEPAFREVLRASGCRLAEVLAELPDETLLVAVRKRFFRKEAFEECPVNRHERRLNGWFWRWTGDRERVRELTQELYCKLLTDKTQDAYDPARLFLPWLWKVARNLWAGEHRRRRRTEPLALWEHIGHGPSPEDEAVARELEERAEAALEGLEEEHRLILRGAMNGHDADQLALQTGLPKPKVYRLLFRARSLVRRVLQSDAGDGEARRGECVDIRSSPIRGVRS